MNVLRMADQDLRGKRVLIREDLNVPVEDGKVTSDARIRASLPTIKLALEKGAKVFLTSHLGRPEEGVYAEEFSLAPVASRLSELLGTPVPLRKDWLAGGVDTAPGSAVLHLTSPGSTPVQYRACDWRSPTRCRTRSTPSPARRR